MQSVIRAIVEHHQEHFSCDKIREDLKMTNDDIGWVWGGLTRRGRTLFGPGAAVFRWKRMHRGGKWVDTAGSVSRKSLDAVRQALRLNPAPAWG